MSSPAVFYIIRQNTLDFYTRESQSGPNHLVSLALTQKVYSVLIPTGMATSGGLRLITLDMKDCVIRMKRPPLLDYIEVAR